MCPVKQRAQTQPADDLPSLLCDSRDKVKLWWKLLSQTYIPSVARIAKQGSVLCLFPVPPHSLRFLNVLHCRCFAHRRFYLDIDCFGRSFCAPNYADE